jgi:hypothetical protein
MVQYNILKYIGVGKHAPGKDITIKMDNDCKIVMGKIVDNEDCSKNSSLLYNEFIVYNTKQINIKYLLKIKFNYK